MFGVRRMFVACCLLLVSLSCLPLAAEACPWWRGCRRVCRPVYYRHYYYCRPVVVVANRPKPPKPTVTEAESVHCLFILGTQDEGIAGAVNSGGEKVRALFNDPALKSKVATRKILRGDEATPEKIIQACASLPVKKNDSIFVFYCGHGATDRSTGQHVLLPQLTQSPGENPDTGAGLARNAIVETLRRRPNRFICFVTDSCSNLVEFERPPAEQPPAVRARSAIARLMLENTGILDINSSTYDPKSGIDERAWTMDEGGVMTLAFVELAQGKGLDPDGDGKLSWKKEFLPELRTRTDELFQQVKGDPTVLADASNVGILNQEHQTVQRFPHES